ncbi:DNA polymerase III subunit beta [Paenibacillus elgii]|uniref:DNA polymerase III subunit beta n=1 Tax=Paenibacillus elgii TaxID=189691 RepID=UPI000248C2E6|nr:DNA polymerase III subunit beta [Paenibacillus elgii]
MAISQAKKLELITKHGRKFAAKTNGATPILEGVHYAAGGSIIATDSYKLLRIGGAHNFAEPFTSHVVTGAPIDGVYPDIARVIPQTFASEITLVETHNRGDLKDAIARVKLAVDIAKLAGDRSAVTTLTYASSTVTLSVENAYPTFSFSAGISAEISGPDVSITFNAEFFLAALSVFKDAGSARVTVGLNKPVEPIVFRDEENDIEAIVLPYRRSA